MEGLLCHPRSHQHVAEVALATTPCPTALIPGGASIGTRPRALFIATFQAVSEGFSMGIMDIDQFLQRDLHILCQVRARGIALHQFAVDEGSALPMKLPGGRGVQTQAKGTRVLLHLRKDVFLDINRFPRCPMPRSTMWVVTCSTVIRRLLFDFQTSSRHRCRQVIIHEPQGMEKDLQPVTQTYAKSNHDQSCLSTSIPPTLKEKTHRNHFLRPLCSQRISGSGLIAEAIAFCIEQQPSSLTEALSSEDLKFTRASLGQTKQKEIGQIGQIGVLSIPT